MNQWDHVLVEWCNCLDLSKKVEHIHDLRDGHFFRNILRVINKSDVDNNEEKTVQSLVHLLNNTYSNSQIDCVHSFLELTEDELRVITSLLMHYTCIFDQRDVLTSPLCHRLSKCTQLNIKNFLQIVDKGILYTDLMKIINEFTQNIGSHGKSTENKDGISSPLTVIFDTPISKYSKFHEKDKEISKLKSTLEMERYEKADLQEELKLQAEKTKKFENLLSKSNEHVTRLRREIIALECRTPPHFKDLDSCETEKRLKKEIQSLEHYIEKREKEEEELREESYRNKKKLTEWETEFAQMQKKFFQSEKKVEELTALSTKQTAQISSLETYCDELKGLVDEFQSKPANESSFFETSSINNRRSLTLVEENLACSVVEVQLKEVQKKNEEILKEVQSLEKNIEEKKIELDHVLSERNACFSDFQALQRDFEELNQSNQDLTSKLTISERTVKEYSNKIQYLEEKLQENEESLNKIIIEKNKCINEIATLKTHVDKVSSKNQELSSKLTISEENILEKEERIKKLTNEHNNLVVELNSTKEIRDEFSKRISLLEESIEELKDQNDQNTSEIEKLNKQIITKEDIISKYEREIEDNDKYLVEKENIIKNLQDEHKNLTANLNAAEKMKNEYSNKIVSLGAVINEEVQERNKNLHEIKTLNEEINTLNTKISEYTMELETQIRINNEHSNKIVSLQSSIDDFTLENSNNLKEIHSLKASVDFHKKEILNYTTELELQKEIILEKEELIKKLEEDHEKVILELENSQKNRDEYLNTISSLQVTIEELKNKNDNNKHEIEKLNEQIITNEDIICKYAREIEDKDKYLVEKEDIIKNLQDEHKNLTANLNAAEKMKNEYSNKIVSLEAVINEEVQERNKNLHQVKTLNEEINTLNTKILEYTMELETQIRINNEHSNKIVSLQSSIDDFTLENSNNLKEIHSLKASVDFHKKEISNYITELELRKEIILEKEELIKKLEEDHEKVILELENSQKNRDEYLNTISSLQVTIEELKNKNDNNKHEIEKLNEQIITNEDIICKYAREIEDKDKYLVEKEDIIKNLQDEHKNLTANLNAAEKMKNEYSNKIVSLEAVINEEVQERNKNLHQVKTLNEEINTLNTKILEYTMELETQIRINNEHSNKIVSLQSSIDDFTLENNNNLKEIHSLKASVDFHKKEISNYVMELELRKEIILEKEELMKNLEEGHGKVILELENSKKIRDEYLNTISSLQVTIEELKNKNDINKHEIEKLNEQIITKEDIICKYAREIEDKNVYLVELNEKIVAYKNLISKNEAELQSQSENLMNKKEMIEKLHKNYKNLQDQILEKTKFFTDITESVKSNMSDMKKFYKKELNLYGNLMLQMKQGLNTCDKKMRESEQHIEELKQKLKNEENEKLSILNNLKAEKEKFNNLIQGNIEKNKILNENQSLKEDYIGLIKMITMYNEELNRIVRNLKGHPTQPKSDMSDFQIAYNHFNKLHQLDSPSKKYFGEKNDEVKKLGEQISKINAYIHVYNEKETFYVKEIDNLKSELATNSNNYYELTQNLKEQNSDSEYQITSLTENLHSVIEKYNQLQVEHRQYLNKIAEYEDEITKFKKAHSELNVSKELKITQLQDEILKSEQDVLALKKIRDEMSEKHQNEIKILEEKQTQSYQEIQSLEEKIKNITMKYKNEIENLEGKISKSEETRCVLQKKLEEISENHSSEIEKFKSEIERKEEEINNLKLKCEGCETKMANLAVQLPQNEEELSLLRRKTEEYESQFVDLQREIVDAERETTNLKIKIEELLEEKNGLLEKIEAVEKEKTEEIVRMKLQLKEKEALYEELKETLQKLKYEGSNRKFLEEKQVELQQKIETLMENSEMQKSIYEEFKIHYKKFKDGLDKLLSQKNILETLTNNLRVLIVSASKNAPSENLNLKKMLDKKETLEIITEDLMKQYNRYSKQINEIVFDVVKYYERSCDNILSTLDIKVENYLEKYNLVELNDQISDLIDRTADALEQVKLLNKDLENVNKVEESIKIQKENILGASKKINVDKMKEDELKKKNLMLRQKVTLLENSKSNLEKTVKKLREENRKIKEDETQPNSDVHYKMLLQEYIACKEEHENILKDYKTKLDNLQKEYEDHKNECMRTSTPFDDGHFFPSEHENRLQSDLINLREAYSNIKIINAKLEAENKQSRKIIEENKQELGKFSLIKDAYDKLLEENNKLITDVDTIKYKRARDRDEFLRLLKKDRSENDSRNTKQIQEIKADYEAKLEKMKDKMIKLYRDEVNKEMSRVKAGQHESSSLLKIIEQLKGDLFESDQKVHLLEMERELLKRNSTIQTSRDSLSHFHLHDSDNRSLRDFPSSSLCSSASGAATRVTAPQKLMEFKHPSKINPSGLDTRRQYDERRVSTLPRTGTVVEEVTISRRTSFGVPDSIGQNIQMEDEEEMFNNKYLTDLKQGKCDLPPSDSRDSRVSELAWRNSLVPPHLKSSYPAETQFCSPERFRDDDIKGSNVPFDDSTSKLLPGEKPRKKDFGTTSYKKPGPPTPSKNGGRLSLQGNEVHPARESLSETKRSTPSRIRALFTGRNSSKSNSQVSPQKRRLNIFRR